MTYTEARIRELTARVAAAQVRESGMLVANSERARHDYAAAYGEEAFEELAKYIDSLAEQIRALAERGDLK